MTLTTYEKCQLIRKIIINRAAEVMNYSWDDEFSVKNIRDIPKDLKERDAREDANSDESLLSIDCTDLTDDEANALGFVKWAEYSPIRLIPLYLFPFLKEEFEAESIDGTVIIKKSEMDNDHRFGCLAYGIIPKDKIEK